MRIDDLYHSNSLDDLFNEYDCNEKEKKTIKDIAKMLNGLSIQDADSILSVTRIVIRFAGLDVSRF